MFACVHLQGHGARVVVVMSGGKKVDTRARPSSHTPVHHRPSIAVCATMILHHVPFTVDSQLAQIKSAVTEFHDWALACSSILLNALWCSFYVTGASRGPFPRP